MSSNIFIKIKDLVKAIPFGKVTTYGSLAKTINTNARVIGWALRGNSDQSVPCHRVVRRHGTLAPGFSLGNWPEQRRRLEAEGIKFSGNQIVNFGQIFIDLNKSITAPAFRYKVKPE